MSFEDVAARMRQRHPPVVRHELEDVLDEARKVPVAEPHTQDLFATAMGALILVIVLSIASTVLFVIPDVLFGAVIKLALILVVGFAWLVQSSPATRLERAVVVLVSGAIAAAFLATWRDMNLWRGATLASMAVGISAAVRLVVSGSRSH